MFTVYIFKDHAIVALSGREFENCLAKMVIDQIDDLEYVMYNNKYIKVYIPNVKEDA